MALLSVLSESAQLWLALENGNVQRVKELLEKMPLEKRVEKVNTLIFKLSGDPQIGSKRMFEALFSMYGDDEKLVNLQSKGETPLHKAIKAGHSVAIEILIGKGAKTQTKDSSGKTPFVLSKMKKGPRYAYPMTPEARSLIEVKGREEMVRVADASARAQVEGDRTVGF